MLIFVQVYKVKSEFIDIFWKCTFKQDLNKFLKREAVQANLIPDA